MVDTSDPRDFHRRLDRQRELLEEASIAESDRDAIKRFIRAKAGSVAVGTLKTYLRRLRRAAELCDDPLTTLDREGYEQFIFELRNDRSLGRGDGPLSDATLKSYEDVVCQFLETECGRAWAGEIERTSVDSDTVDASAMLDADDIAALREAARHQRDVALVEFLADTGARIGLVCSLRVRDVDLDGERATYQPNPNAVGLKGAQITPYPIIDSAVDLRQYLHGTHPRPDEPDAALFHRLRRFDDDIDADDGACDPSALRNHLTRLGDRAGLDKPTNPHNFRHSAITRMVREGFSRDQVEHRVQWTVDSDMWANYVHIDAAEHNDDIFAAAGVAEGETPSPERDRCGECGTQLGPNHRHCPQCGRATSGPRRALLRAWEDALVDAMADADDYSERDALRGLREQTRDDPSRVPDALGNRPELAEYLSRHL